MKDRIKLILNESVSERIGKCIFKRLFLETYEIDVYVKSVDKGEDGKIRGKLRPKKITLGVMTSDGGLESIRIDFGFSFKLNSGYTFDDIHPTKLYDDFEKHILEYLNVCGCDNVQSVHLFLTCSKYGKQIPAISPHVYKICSCTSDWIMEGNINDVFTTLKNPNIS